MILKKKYEEVHYENTRRIYFVNVPFIDFVHCYHLRISKRLEKIND